MCGSWLQSPLDILNASGYKGKPALAVDNLDEKPLCFGWLGFSILAFYGKEAATGQDAEDVA
jgi:hypothetical protein